MKRAVMMAVLAVALAALAVPVIGLRARAAGQPSPASAAGPASARAASPALAFNQQQSVVEDFNSPAGRINPDVVHSLGLQRLPKGVSAVEASKRIAAKLLGRSGSQSSNIVLAPDSGQPLVMNAASALSSALITAIGGRDNQFSEITLIADWDGREDCVADREQKVDDFSFTEVEIDVSLTRTAISEHTSANGYNENVYYYGDSLGNLWVGTDTNPGINAVNTAAIDALRQVNIPTLVSTGASGGFTLLNPQAGDCTDDQITVTGIAVQPVADLGDFGLCDTIGEVVYVSTLDTEGCSSNAANQVFRTRIFAFAFTDGAGAGAATPAGAIQILRNSNSNVAGVAVDDDGSLYFQLLDLIQFSTAAIFKVEEGPRTVAGCAVNPRRNRVVSSIPSGLSGGIALNTAATTALTAGGFRLTNYSGPAATFGNVISITSGPCNVLYAAVSRSFVATDDAFTQNTEGRFTNPSALGATPSMIITFADCQGLTDSCSSPAAGQPGQIPIADGFADGPAAGVARVVGVNNFRVFVLGNGPDIRPPAGQTSNIVTAGTLKVDMQIDYTSHSGIAVSEEGTVFIISGGTPAGIGTQPSPLLGEILCFEDMCPMDRRADFVDLRGDALPNPPASGGNVGDGDSDRFDHIFYQAPLDQVTLTPGGLAGLARGFLLYTNRVRNRNVGTLANLPNGAVQGDDASSGVLVFEDFDLGHQVAGGDDQNTPFRGDDNDGAGNPVLVGALSGGFEFLFGGPVGVSGCVWNGFFLNSNGSITFGAGDTDNSPTIPEFRTNLPKIAVAWADLNPAARAVNPINFPVQALGFANVNAFRVRWINVPEFLFENCDQRNTFSVTLYDDGTARDENEAQLLDPADPTGDNVDPAFDEQEGPTDLRFVREPNTNVLVGCPPRPDGSGHFIFEYCRMDLLGTPDRPVLVGYSIGGLSPLNPPGLCETNLGEAARASDTGPFGVIQGQTASIMPCLIGEGTEPTLFEFFNEGRDAGIGTGGEIGFATPDFDLRFEGNDAALCTPTRQRDLNRGKVGFFGIGCAPPANPLCQQVVFGPFVTNPTTTGVVNALCAVQVNLVGCGFFPNETTIVCQGFGSETGQPLPRPGKTVSTAVALACDTNGDGIAETVVALGAVTPLNKNLVRGTLNPIAPNLPGTAFPAACCGGAGTFTVTTTFTSGDNNAFGPFTRTSVCSAALGVRAPIVFSVTPSDGNCAVPQDLLISGACFIIPQGSITSVFAVERGNANNVIQATRFVVLNNNLIDALFNFGTANAGKTFLIFVTGPGGTSRNLSALPAGSPAGCPLGNEQGVQVTFACTTVASPGPEPGPQVIPVVNGCRLNRSAAGAFLLELTGRNIMNNATVTVGGSTPRKVKFRELDTQTNTFSKLILKGRFCTAIPGIIVVTNPGSTGGPSSPFQCNERCAAQ